MKPSQKQQKIEKEITQSSSRLLTILRFGLFGAIGFGFGGFFIAALAVFGFVFQGAIGGLALGLAMRDSKKAKFLALAGALGLILGFIFNLFVYNYIHYLLFIIGIFSIETFRVSILQRIIDLGLASAIIGTIEGLSLGIVFKDWKHIIILALAGGLGYFIGGFIYGLYFTGSAATASIGIQSIINFGIGGLSLGLALGWLETNKNK